MSKHTMNIAISDGDPSEVLIIISGYDFASIPDFKKSLFVGVQATLIEVIRRDLGVSEENTIVQTIDQP